tara:strand:+ start:13428 stop:14387 length:960 start_codon:yes stop_codon:yes gene_type:complete
MNRIDRLTAMIIFLQGRQFVPIAEMVNRYGISERTIYRDLKSLQEAGVPIGFENGKGYYIVSGYRLPPVMFSKEEAASMLAGERMMQRWNGSSLSDSYVSALDKIRAVLPTKEKNYLDTLDQHIKAFPYPDRPPSNTDSKVFDFLQNAIFQKKVIEIKYRSPYKDDTTKRNVEPLGLLLRGNYWYLAAWCLVRADYRLFRIDRMESYSYSKSAALVSKSHSLEEFYELNLKEEERDIHKVVVRFSDDMYRYLGDQKYYHGWVSEIKIEDGRELTFLSYSIEYMARWLLGWGNSVQIIEPASLKNRLKELVQELYNHHCD